MVIPGLLEHNLLVTGMGPDRPPRMGVEFTPEFAVQLDTWLEEYA